MGISCTFDILKLQTQTEPQLLLDDPNLRETTGCLNSGHQLEFAKSGGLRGWSGAVAALEIFFRVVIKKLKLHKI